MNLSDQMPVPKHHLGLLELMVSIHPPTKIPIPVPPSPSAKGDEPQRRPLQLSEQGQVLEIAIETAANAVLDLKDSLNDWDSKVGDGDWIN
ncbi:hypothetical protein Ahy_A05g022694 isoform D [Arachis hypogaea]|uniref:Uncharacterized protein n=1 Tax=Arachis hypogaea TaxID=3818 RepID=A0A445D1L0_ARAHY|nr:hypothetical protein Ahy_A05g022694 isoform D [Arachis hypogaea]